MRGRVEVVEVSSRILSENPLHDPSVRELGIYLPPSYGSSASRRYPMVMVLAGYTGTGLAHMNKLGWTEPFDRRLDRLTASSIAREAIFVFPDCFTRYGGSQYIDSPAVGRYESYLVEEIVAFVDARYRTQPERSARGVIGKSSGGYGAMILALHRPDVFGAVASHAGDCAFELCYGPELPKALLMLERHGGIDGFLAWFDSQPSKPNDAMEVMSNLLAAACWSPSKTGPYRYGGGFDLPFDIKTGERIGEVWARWLAWDPVHMLDGKEALDAMRSMRAIYLDGGLTDEYNLQLGARQIAKRLSGAGITFVHEEFEGGHFNVQYRYDRSLEVITNALTDTSRST
jgi:enterochelin esterase family protein